MEGTESYTANTAVSAPVANYSGYNYGPGGRLQSVAINDGHPRTIAFGTNIEGQILSRAENDNVGGTVDQYERHFYFDGMALGDVSNNGTSDTDYAASIAAHIAVPGSGNLRGGATVAMPYADFDQSYDPVNGITYAGAPSHYTAQDGDTLAGIAAMVWGDASLWYLIADANGLSSPSDSLTAGTDLILPNKVVNLHNNASTFKVYDPNEAIGDTAPTVPKQPKHDGNNCGVFGQILKAVVAIVVTVVTGGNAVLGDLAAQVFGLATGIQKSFNWNELAESGITAGVANGLQEVGMVVQTTSEIFNAVANAVITNVVSQGIEVATGLQKSFDWAGVAASGIGGGVGYAVGDWAGSQDFFDGNATLNQVATTVFASTARDIVSAAARTLIDGSDFGDNIIAVLPDVLASAVGAGIQSPGGEAASDDFGAQQTGKTGDVSNRSGPTMGSSSSLPSTGYSSYGGLAGFVDSILNGTGGQTDTAQVGKDDDLAGFKGFRAAPTTPVEVGYLPPVAGTQLSMDDVHNIGTTALALFRQQYEGNGGGSFQQVNLLGDGSGFLGLPSAKDLQSEIQGTLSDLANQASQATGDAAKALRADYNAAVRLAATVSISATIADPSTSADARMVLQSFLTGDGPRDFHFGPNSTGVAELFNYNSSDYYYAQEDGAVDFMLNTKYHETTLRDGDQITGYANGSYNALYGAWGLTDGTQMGDITGTFTSGLAAKVANDTIYFGAKNDMDLVSFAAGNLFKVQNDLINVPASGPLSTVHMTFEWTRPVPPMLNYNNYAHH
ncbi:MAG: LysM peptidoglycan-binding domain-containing protein [Rhizomicrobium sp.]